MIEDDPESCSYVPLAADLEGLVRERFAAEFEREIESLNADPGTIGLDSVALSVEYNAEGDRWLRLLATDGTSWYLGWDGGSLAAITAGGEFGQTVGHSLAP